MKRGAPMPPQCGYDAVSQMSDAQDSSPPTLIDALTSIANHARFHEFLQREWRAAEQAGDVISLLAIDLDRFQSFRDTYGRDAADDCLQQVGGVLKNRIRRSTDLPARTGGEQFAVVLPGTPAEGAGPVAEAVRTLVQQLQIPHGGSPASPHVSVSIGIATIAPQRGAQAGELIAAAARALATANAGGGNRSCHDESA